MPRARGSEMPQRQSPRGPHPLQTSSYDLNPPYHRPIIDRSPKLVYRCSPKSVQSDPPLNQKKLGTHIVDLESQLGQAQEELKMLKQQLDSAEIAKKEAQEELKKKTKKPVVPEPENFQEKHHPSEAEKFNKSDVPDDNQCETDVFEVLVEKVTTDCNQVADQAGKETELSDLSISLAILEPEKPSFDLLALKNKEINVLRSKLEEKEKDLESFGQENEKLKNQLSEAVSKITSAQKTEEEMSVRLNQLGEELEASITNAAKLDEKLRSVKGEKEALEAEMKKLRVQTEQWRKAADAAAAVLAVGVEMNGRISERYGFMDKHFGGVFVPSASGYTSFVGSPGMADDFDDGFGSGKRKGSGIRMFGELWKKKSQK